MGAGAGINDPNPVGFGIEVAAGNITGMSAINKFGRNPDCDTAASSTAVVVARDVWDGSIAGAVNWVPPTAASLHAIVSTSVEDDPDKGGATPGTGAFTIRVFGLDSAYALQQEDVELNGAAAVNTAKTYTMIHRMYALTWGTGGANVGAITATAASGSTVTAKITALMNQTLMAIYQIPAGKSGYMSSWNGEIHKAGGATVLADLFLMSRELGGGWRVRDTGVVSSSAKPTFERHYFPPKTFGEKSYVKVAANPSADAQDIAGGFDLVLVDG